MHEFSIAVNVIDIVEENTKKADAKMVSRVDIEVGQFSGILIDALELALQQAKQNSMAKDANFVIIEIQGRLKCQDCNHEFLAENIFTPCPKCGSYLLDIIQGKELRVKSIEVD